MSSADLSSAGIPPTHGEALTRTVADGSRAARVDAWAAAQGLAPSRSQVQRLIDDGLLTVNGKAVRPNHRLQPGDVVSVAVVRPAPLDIVAEDLPLDIVFEDAFLAVVNKPAGMVVHPAPGNWEGTLVHALLHHMQGLSGIGGRERPGIVHRLDRDTSGLLVVAKSDMAHSRLSAQLASRRMGRRYQALTVGVPRPAQGTVELAIGRDYKDRKRVSAYTNHARSAVTHYRTLEAFPRASGGVALVELKLETGRTHQIRVHLEHMGWPVLGDPVYGGRRRVFPPGLAVPRLMLHAARLTLIHPDSGEQMTFEAPLPEDFCTLLATLRAETAGAAP
ncbi:MAG: RluA family pseudouridine synthase [Nitrospirota bacterium]|nr:RluA family pseudouridine synthase [Nitrospirota bacterium]